MQYSSQQELYSRIVNQLRTMLPSYGYSIASEENDIDFSQIIVFENMEKNSKLRVILEISDDAIRIEAGNISGTYQSLMEPIPKDSGNHISDIEIVSVVYSYLDTL